MIKKIKLFLNLSKPLAATIGTVNDFLWFVHILGQQL